MPHSNASSRKLSKAANRLVGTYALEPQWGNMDGSAIGTKLGMDHPRKTPDAAHAQGADNHDAVGVLNDLRESCRDGEYSFRNSSENAEATELKRVFSRHSEESAEAASELETEIRALGGEPATGGSLSGALHRGWVSVKTALTIQDDQAVLQACERSEDSAVGQYCKALQNPLPANALAMVERQVQVAQRNHDEVRDLCDRYDAT